MSLLTLSLRSRLSIYPPKNITKVFNTKYLMYIDIDIILYIVAQVHKVGEEESNSRFSGMLTWRLIEILTGEG